MTGRYAGAHRRLIAFGAVVLALAGCTSGDSDSDPGVLSGGFNAARIELVAFDSCEETLDGLRAAARFIVGPWGLGDGAQVFAAGAESRDVAGAPEAAADLGGEADSAGPAYSGTNVHEQGVDEPDLVKTDGRRIVTVGNGALWVIDAASKQVTGRLELVDDALRYGFGYAAADLLLAGDHALVLMDQNLAILDREMTSSDLAQPAPDPQALMGPQVLLVDLGSDKPRILGTFTIDGGLVDARQIGSTARIVVRSSPRLMFPYDEKLTDPQRMEANTKIIETAGISDWLPRYEVTTGATVSSGQIDCSAVSHPPSYSGTEMLTVLTFDIGQESLDSGDPVTIVADGDTVYSTADSLYITHDQRWRAMPIPAPGRGSDPAEIKLDERTELYKFDISEPGPPRLAASGAVPGWLINQYSLSEWEGELRVATTTGMTWAGLDTESESAVYVFRQDGESLAQIGHVGGLGKGEQIFGVRFVGPVGYVVTFRQTDPLYTIDLSDPREPVVAGELKITGFSSYLHPAGDGRLIGIGQDATTEGQATGTQVSLFDVSNPEEPTRIAQHHIEYGSSEAEYDPHAFLYWPDTGLLVVPITTWGPVRSDGSQLPVSGALALTMRSGGFTELGLVTHPQEEQFSDFYSGSPTIRRSLVIGDVLWTISDFGVQASDADNLDQLAWLPFTAG